MTQMDDFWLRELGLEVLARPESLVSATSHPVEGAFQIAPHHHDGVLQFDLLFGCRGTLLFEDSWLRFEQDVGYIAYPGQVHGYSLEPRDSDALVCHFRLRVSDDLHLISKTLLPAMVLLGDAADRLRDDATKAVQSTGDPRFPRAAGAMALLLLLSRWPRSGFSGQWSQPRPVDEHVETAVTLIEASLDEPPTLEALADAAGLSGRHLSRLFVQVTGMTPQRYATVRRLDRAKMLLVNQDRSIGSVSDELGFSTPATFTRWFHGHEGRTPSEFREQPSVF
ncbi:MAG: AraC family transcriptional regulator [Planctomycetota bacterium]